MLLDRVTIETSHEKIWQLENTVLAHPPGDESSASRMSDRIKDMYDAMSDAILLAQKAISREQLEEKRAADDGIMRVIE